MYIYIYNSNFSSVDPTSRLCAASDAPPEDGGYRNTPGLP